jgi:protein tyrosine phosphatase
MTVKPVSVENLTDHLQRRTFHLTDTFTGRENLPVVQLHYTGWPDHGVPSGETMDSFRIMLDEFIRFLLTKDEKAIVHCSAGVGRTGTTIVLAHLIMNLWAQKNAGIQDPKMSVFSTVRRIRWHRAYLVQS